MSWGKALDYCRDWDEQGTFLLRGGQAVSREEGGIQGRARKLAS